MNLRVLNQSISRNFNEVRPRIESVFGSIIDKVAVTGQSINVSSFIGQLNMAMRGTKIRVVKETTTKF